MGPVVSASASDMMMTVKKRIRILRVMVLVVIIGEYREYSCISSFSFYLSWLVNCCCFICIEVRVLICCCGVYGDCDCLMLFSFINNRSDGMERGACVSSSRTALF